MTGHELILALEKLPSERLDQTVMISVRHDTRDEWPRRATVLSIRDIPGEDVIFLGLTGFADDHPDGEGWRRP